MEGAPNLISYLVLILCPLVSFALVATLRPPVAVAIIILAGQMFMPPIVSFDPPFIPPLGKDTLPPLSALLACAILRPRSLMGGRPGRGYDLFIVLMVFGYLGTAMSNPDPVRFGPRVLSGHTFHDFLSSAPQDICYWWPPFFLGRTLFRKSKDLKTLFVLIAIGGVLYTPLLALEMKMSPQLNMWVYGFHQTEFQQTVRSSGFYRPKVFMRHGLNVAFFMAFTVLAAGALAKAKQRVGRFKAGTVLLYLILFLALCRSGAAITYVGFFLPIIWFARIKIQARWAAILAVLIFMYPVARSTGLVPVDDINNFFLSVFGQERAGSLAYRLTQEALVMDRALERIFFGWGGYDRPFPHDPYTGNEVLFIDGLWVIQIGSRGIVGFVALFGLLLLPAWRVRRTLERITDPRDRILVSCLGLMAVIYAMDLIPNSSIDPYLTFLVGVLAGAERGFEAEAPTPTPAPARGLASQLSNIGRSVRRPSTQS